MSDAKHETDPPDELIMSYEDSCDRVPVLWIHGFPLNNMLWDPQVAGLADIARLITPDLRGHGLTDPTPPPYSVRMFADDCARLLDHVGCAGPVVVAGLSMGGYVAFEFCRRYPERVAGLILASTRAGADTEAGRAGRETAAGAALAQGVGAIVDSMLPKLMAPATYEEQPDLVEFVGEMMGETSADGIVGALAAMRDRPDSSGDLGGLRIPALVVHGVDDQLIPPSEARVMHEGIPGAELCLIPDAGHLPNLEQPEVFNDAVRAFLEQFYDED